MRRSARPTKNEANLENKAQRVPRDMKTHSNNKISSIATLDNVTMVEVFKYLNYCQLANNSVVSKKFHDLIQTHRHKLALLYIYSINMGSFPIGPSIVHIFDEELFPEAYDEWVIRNHYSKQVPLEDQDASTQNIETISNGYLLSAHAYYTEVNTRVSHFCDWIAKETSNEVQCDSF